MFSIWFSSIYKTLLTFSDKYHIEEHAYYFKFAFKSFNTCLRWS